MSILGDHYETVYRMLQDGNFIRLAYLVPVGGSLTGELIRKALRRLGKS